MTVDDPSGRFMGWLLHLPEYDLQVCYKNDRDNKEEDAP